MNDEVKTAVKATWKEVLGTRDEDAKQRCLETYKEEKRKYIRCVHYIRARRRYMNSLEGR